MERFSENLELKKILLEEGSIVYGKHRIEGLEKWAENYSCSEALKIRIKSFYDYVSKRNGAASTRVITIGEVLVDDFLNNY